jgi:hypothetical protein
MPINMQKFKATYGIASGTKDRVAINFVIRKIVPGGQEVLGVIERLIRMQHGRPKPDPVLQDLLDTLVHARDRMADALCAAFEAEKSGPPLAENRVDWSTADWKKSDAELARIYGVSRQNVRARRMRYGVTQEPEAD